MDGILALWKWIVANPGTVAEWYLAIVGLASLIVKVTPTLKDDEWLTKIIKIIGKYIALDKYGPDGAPRPK